MEVVFSVSDYDINPNEISQHLMSKLPEGFPEFSVDVRMDSEGWQIYFELGIFKDCDVYFEIEFIALPHVEDEMPCAFPLITECQRENTTEGLTGAVRIWSRGHSWIEVLCFDSLIQLPQVMTSADPILYNGKMTSKADLLNTIKDRYQNGRPSKETILSLYLFCDMMPKDYDSNVALDDLIIDGVIYYKENPEEEKYIKKICLFFECDDAPVYSVPDAIRRNAQKALSLLPYCYLAEITDGLRSTYIHKTIIGSKTALFESSWQNFFSKDMISLEQRKSNARFYMYDLSSLEFYTVFSDRIEDRDLVVTELQVEPFLQSQLDSALSECEDAVFEKSSGLSGFFHAMFLKYNRTIKSFEVDTLELNFEDGSRTTLDDESDLEWLCELIAGLYSDLLKKTYAIRHDLIHSFRIYRSFGFALRMNADEFRRLVHIVGGASYRGHDFEWYGLCYFDIPADMKNDQLKKKLKGVFEKAVDTDLQLFRQINPTFYYRGYDGIDSFVRFSDESDLFDLIRYRFIQFFRWNIPGIDFIEPGRDFVRSFIKTVPMWGIGYGGLDLNEWTLLRDVEKVRAEFSRRESNDDGSPQLYFEITYYIGTGKWSLLKKQPPVGV